MLSTCALLTGQLQVPCGSLKCGSHRISMQGETVALKFTTPVVQSFKKRRHGYLECDFNRNNLIKRRNNVHF